MNTVIGFSLILAVALGCARIGEEPARVPTNVAVVELADSTCAVFRKIRVLTGKGETEVTGWLRSRCGRNLNRPGHVRLQVTSRDGRVLDEQEARYILERRPRKPPRKAHFHFLIPFEVPPGSRILLAHHPAGEEH